MYPSVSLAIAYYRATELQDARTAHFARSITLASRRRDELARRELRAGDRMKAGRRAGRTGAGNASARPATAVTATADTGAAAALAPCGAC